jgi:hypothetical protein
VQADTKSLGWLSLDVVEGAFSEVGLPLYGVLGSSLAVRPIPKALLRELSS